MKKLFITLMARKWAKRILLTGLEEFKEWLEDGIEKSKQHSEVK